VVVRNASCGLCCIFDLSDARYQRPNGDQDPERITAASFGALPQGVARVVTILVAEVTSRSSTRADRETSQMYGGITAVPGVVVEGTLARLCSP
jgi:hypothetical protein